MKNCVLIVGFIQFHGDKNSDLVVDLQTETALTLI